MGKKKQAAQDEAASDSPVGNAADESREAVEARAQETFDGIVGNDPPEDVVNSEMEWFTVAEALAYLGKDAKYPSSHVIHRTMVGVVMYPDGGVRVGAYVEQQPEKWDRMLAGRDAIMAASRSPKLQS